MNKYVFTIEQLVSLSNLTESDILKFIESTGIQQQKPIRIAIMGNTLEHLTITEDILSLNHKCDIGDVVVIPDNRQQKNKLLLESLPKMDISKLTINKLSIAESKSKKQKNHKVKYKYHK